MSILNTIRGALENHLLNMVGVPTVYFQNITNDPDPNTTFIKSTFVVTDIQPATRGLNPQLRYDGFLSLLICTPEGNGIGAGLEMAQLLQDRFAPTTDISFGGIIVSIDKARLAPDYFDAPFNCLPLTINWYIYNSN